MAIVLLVLSGAAVASVGAQGAVPSGVATVISPDGVNVRASPSASSSILQVLPFDSTVTLAGAPTDDGWYPVTVSGQSGWVSGSFLAAGSLDASVAGSASPLSVGIAGAPPAPPAIVHGAAIMAGTGGAPSPAPPAVQAGQAETMTASYYGIDDSTVPGTMMACGAPFDPFNTHDASTNDFSCGTKLLVTGPDGRQIEVVVTDHGAYRQHWMDLTYAAFGMLADHRQGVIQVSVKVEP